MTIIHHMTHLTPRFTTTRTSLLISPQISLITQPSANKLILEALASPECYHRWLKKLLPMLLRAIEHRMEIPGNLPQAVERWTVCGNKWSPFLPIFIDYIPAFARRVVLSNLCTLSICSLSEDST